MNILSITNSYTHVRLSRLQCAAISQACWLASQEGVDPDLDRWRTLSSLFHCCAAAGPRCGALAPPILLPAELAYVAWEEDIIRLELSPWECVSLARACWFAGQSSPGQENAQDITAWVSLAGLFQACAIAGLGQWHMSPQAVEALEAQLAAFGL